ncbi:hypothetical protein K469DRAFT_444705, partial [Zopfia rhizophila CBS 207.26]
MLSGVSISDLFTIIHLVRNTWRKCQDAPNEFSEATRELSSLHTVLSVVGDAENQDSAFSQADPECQTQILHLIERKIDDIAADLRQGKRAASVLSTYEDQDADIWDVLKKELPDEGITPQDIEEHKTRIKAYIKTL